MTDRRLEAARGLPLARGLTIFVVLMFAALWAGIAAFHQIQIALPGRYVGYFPATGSWECDAQIELFLHPEGPAVLWCPGPEQEARTASGTWQREGETLRLRITSLDLRTAVTRDEDVCFVKGTHQFRIGYGELAALGVEDDRGRASPYRHFLHGFADEVLPTWHKR